MNCLFGHERACRFIGGAWDGQTRTMRADQIIFKPPGYDTSSALFDFFGGRRMRSMSEPTQPAQHYAFFDFRDGVALYRLMTQDEWHIAQRELYFYRHRQWPEW